VLAAQRLGLDANLLSAAILRALWRDDWGIADEAVLRSLAIECSMEPEPVLELALSADIQRQFKECTARAIEVGVPGSPTYCVDGQLFYRQDRLMFVEHQLKQGFRQDHRNTAGACCQHQHTTPTTWSEACTLHQETAGHFPCQPRQALVGRDNLITDHKSTMMIGDGLGLGLGLGLGSGIGSGWLWMIVILVLVGLAIAALARYLGK